MNKEAAQQEFNNQRDTTRIYPQLPFLTTNHSYYSQESSINKYSADSLALVNSTPSRSAFHYLDRRLLPTTSSDSPTLVLLLSLQIHALLQTLTITHALDKFPLQLRLAAPVARLLEDSRKPHRAFSEPRYTVLILDL
ncbi:hypothetical protein PGT21_023816 [Puccinia graminis f. sp. tritici]|uniref:Uncharacterized protein n=1 Tax=Puccinia graminis f. sp. tritici TaxID=56615 RepID=A0A5B0MNU2_PUCGR|nr:hypothetical protein PGT21_023816 [Puccinia graminis f. sp. tritici]